MKTSQANNQTMASSNMTLDQWYEMILVVIHGWCSVVTLPVEYALRPRFGTRYFNPIVVGFSCLMMMCLPLTAVLTSMMSNLLSFGFGHPQTKSLLDAGTLTTCFFIGSAVHGFRLWRRMVNPETEYYGEWEGPALPFFSLLPRGNQFWWVRLGYEPAFVTVLASTLLSLHIIDSASGKYLKLAALMLFVKMSIEWYKNWLRLRILMDSEVSATLLSKYLSGNASDDDLAVLHIARPPKGIPVDIIDRVNEQRATGLPPDIQRLVTPVHPEYQSDDAPVGADSVVNPVATDNGAEDARRTTKRSRFEGGETLFMVLMAFAASGILLSHGAAQQPQLQVPPKAQSIVPPNLIVPTIPNLSGIWVNSMKIGQVTMSYRIDLVQKGADITGYSRRDLKGPLDSAHVMFPITGKALDGGKRFTFQEGSMMESYPATRPWCSMQSLTLMPTPQGTLTGTYEASPCKPGIITLHRGR